MLSVVRTPFASHNRLDKVLKYRLEVKRDNLCTKMRGNEGGGYAANCERKWVETDEEI